MAFTRPAVHVWQELVNLTASPNTPFMELCVIGPAYQVVRNAACDKYTAGAAYTTAYKDSDLGVVIDQASVQCVMKNVDIKVWPSVAATLSDSITIDNKAATTVLKATTGKEFNTAGVAVGDTAVVVIDAVTYTSAVHSLGEDNLTLTLRKNIPTETDTGTGTLTIIRRVPPDDTTKAPYEFSVPKGASGITVDTDGVDIATSVTCQVNSITYRIYAADVFLTYRGLRTAIANDFIQITSDTQGAAQVGDPDPLNPLSVAIPVVYANVNIPFKVLPVQTDDADGYIKALDVLTTTEKVYVIVPLTQDKNAVSAISAHCTAMSSAEKSRWRITYANMATPVTKIIIEINDGSLEAGPDGDHLYLKDVANGVFASRSARISDFMDIYDDSNVLQFSLKITQILNDTVAILSNQKYTKTDEGYEPVLTNGTVTVSTPTPYQYEVVRVLDTQGVADEMVEIAHSFNSKRIRLLFPDQVMMTIGNVKYTMPGYYLAVAYGAMRAGFPPHQGFTTLGVGGIDRILGSNNRFTDDQLDQMAGGGVFVVVQDDPEANPYCIYQTTTDTTALEVKEDSIVATVDYASKFYRDNLKQVIGRMNVNDTTVQFVAAVLKSCTEKMQGMTYPYIGPVLLAGKTKSITKDADKIKPVQVIEVPFPVNEIDLYLEV